MKKVLSLVFCFMFGLIMLTGCGSSKDVTQDGKAIIRFMVGGSAGELEQYKIAVDAFNAQSTSAQVELIGLPGDGYNEKLLTQLASKTPPDCFYSEEASYGELNNSDKLLDLTELLNEGKNGLTKADIPESLLEFCTHNDKIT